MLNAKQITTMNEAGRSEEGKKGRKKSEKNFLDRVIWIDLPVNAAILAYTVVWVVRAFQAGLDVTMAKIEMGVNITGIPDLDETILWCLPVMAVAIAIATVVEVLYLILKLCGKEPFLTEKYAITTLIVKVLLVVFTAATALLFL